MLKVFRKIPIRYLTAESGADRTTAEENKMKTLVYGYLMGLLVFTTFFIVKLLGYLDICLTLWGV